MAAAGRPEARLDVGEVRPDVDAGRLEVTVSGYHATWHPTEQSPEIAIGTAACPDEFCSLDRTARGRTDRWIANGSFEADGWTASAYAAALRLVDGVGSDLRLPDQPVRPALDRGRAFRDATRVDRGVRVDGRRRDAVRPHGARRRRPHRRQRVRREHQRQSVREGSVAAFSEATWYADVAHPR